MPVRCECPHESCGKAFIHYGDMNAVTVCPHCGRQQSIRLPPTGADNLVLPQGGSGTGAPRGKKYAERALANAKMLLIVSDATRARAVQHLLGDGWEALAVGAPLQEQYLWAACIIALPPHLVSEYRFWLTTDLVTHVVGETVGL